LIPKQTKVRAQRDLPKGMTPEHREQLTRTHHSFGENQIESEKRDVCRGKLYIKPSHSTLSLGRHDYEEMTLRRRVSCQHSVIYARPFLLSFGRRDMDSVLTLLAVERLYRTRSSGECQGEASRDEQLRYRSTNKEISPRYDGHSDIVQDER
jgi:hypothetical protein